MKGKSIFIVAAIIAAATLLFAACNKQNDGHTGLHVFVTDENGNTVLDKNGEPKTEEWITEIVYATDENGETYTNINGEKVTVKQTRPAYTVVYEETEFKVENGKPVTDVNGDYVYVPVTQVIYEDVTDKSGNKVTEVVTDNLGNDVTEENGQPVTEVVTEKRTEKVTYYVEVTLDGQQTMYNVNSSTSKPKTTSIYENPLYTERETKKTTNPAQTTQKVEKHLASISWVNTVDGSKNDAFAKVIPAGANAFIALGRTESKDGAFSAFTQTGLYTVVSKYNSDGTHLWTCPIGSSGHTRIHDIALLKDGSIIAVGESTAKDLGFTSDASYEAIIAKISSSGKLIWIKSYGGSATEYFKCATETPDGGFVAAGRFKATDGDFASLALTSLAPVFVKCDTNGNIVWFNTFKGSGADAVNAIASDAKGNIYGACQIVSTDLDGNGNHGNADIGIIKFSSSGSKLWVKMIGGSKSDIVNDIYADANGCVFAGSYTSADGDFTLNRGGKDAFIGSCDAQGNVKWIRTFGGLKNDSFNAVISTQFGYTTVGETSSTNRDFESIGNSGESDGFIMSINSAGTVEHVKSVAGTGADGLYDICQLDSKTYIFAGETYSKDKDFDGKQTKGCAGVFGKAYIY
ncbi:MAG: hypothetical protein IIW48_04375 [Clostridia bacterium]|nr:hypothetical protein [Clostridia bacterium]